MARLTASLKDCLRGLEYERANARWELAETQYRAHGWTHARRIVAARRLIESEDADTTLFTMGRYLYRRSSAWPTIWSRLFNGLA